eukprot:SAG31_NODE_20597_length_570_cov_0.656051_1_plen_89_part_01
MHSAIRHFTVHGAPKVTAVYTSKEKSDPQPPLDLANQKVLRPEDWHVARTHMSTAGTRGNTHCTVTHQGIPWVRTSRQLDPLMRNTLGD